MDRYRLSKQKMVGPTIVYCRPIGVGSLGFLLVSNKSTNEERHIQAIFYFMGMYKNHILHWLYRPIIRLKLLHIG